MLFVINQVHLIVPRLLSGVVSADKVVSNKMEVLSVNSTTPDEKETIIKVTGAKRKLGDRRLSSIQLCIKIDTPRFAVGLCKYRMLNMFQS